MKGKKTNYRALRILDDVCIGCAHCMRVCPTEALRVSNGKAAIHAEWCIDCGECFSVCPTRAVGVMDDDLEKSAQYKHKILLVPSVFFAQFSKKTPRETLYNILGELGFDEICMVEQSVDLILEEVNEYVQREQRPVISSYCPAVVRLIQVRFPFLVDRIMRLLPPMEVTAQYYQKKYVAEGGKEEDLGIFYVTPCIAKTASVRSPVGGYVSPITGVINMDHLYNKVYLAYKQNIPITRKVKINDKLSSKAALYPTTGGESAHIKGRTLAIDGMKNVLDFLELLESEKIQGVDFLELRICDESCAGGILSYSNRFLVADRLRQKAQDYSDTNALLDEYKKYCTSVVRMDEIEPRSMVKYDKDIDKALKKMERARLLKDLLPGIDCGGCGAPSCEALAEDVVRGQANIYNCIFLRTAYEKRGDITQNETTQIMEEIWGKDRFNIE